MERRNPRFKSFSQGFPDIKSPAPRLDVKQQYKKLKQVIRQEKQRQHIQWLSNIPYHLGYAILIVIVFIFLAKGSYQAAQAHQISILQDQRESEQCLIKYQQKQCSLENVTAGGQCKKLWDCMRKKNQNQGTFNYLSDILNRSFQMITKDILGPIMIGVLAFMLKIIQILTNKKDNQNNHQKQN